MNRFLSAQSREELTEWVKERQFPAFRAKQIASWLYDRAQGNPDLMDNLPLVLRAALKEDFIAPAQIVGEIASGKDGVEKLALTLHDGEVIEMVVIPSRERLTFCLSTQVGCPVGCRFCESGRNGLVRNLDAGEIIGEFQAGVARAGRPDNIVFMGIGEGLLNFEQLAKALERLTSPEYFGMSPRRITVSTSGYVPGMEKLAALGREYNLAVSLHAVDDATRAKIIPDKLRYPVADILKAADHYCEASGRQYTIEYTLLAGINDSLAAAKKLGELARAHRAKINLIPYNRSSAGNYSRPAKLAIEEFENTVAATGARVTRRVERGANKSAACGQLRTSLRKGKTLQQEEAE